MKTPGGQRGYSITAGEPESPQWEFLNVSREETHFNETFLPSDMKFNDGHVVAIVAYSLLMIVSAIGNVSVLSIILRLRMKGRLSRVNLFLLHLSVADLLVTFLLMPLEIGWNATVSWRAGDLSCRLLSFFRTFGLFLSGFILVCISLDRYFALCKPMYISEANRRGRNMLYASWIGSFVCSFPQALIFHVEKHPHFTWFEQCVTFNSFRDEYDELGYFIFGFVFYYAFPLTVILFSYSSILIELYRINRLVRSGEDIRRSNLNALGRAKIRTLKMSVAIVVTFFLCWTPYNIMSLWYHIDKASASQVDPRIQKGLFFFASTNSSFNPMVYGFFHIKSKALSTTTRGNNVQIDKDREDFKVRVRWRPRECFCGTNSSTMNSSSATNMRLRPMYEFNGGAHHLYLQSGHQLQHHRRQPEQLHRGPSYYKRNQNVRKCLALHGNLHQYETFPLQPITSKRVYTGGEYINERDLITSSSAPTHRLESNLSLQDSNMVMKGTLKVSPTEEASISPNTETTFVKKEIDGSSKHLGSPNSNSDVFENCEGEDEFEPSKHLFPRI